jgi:glycosyltransferase involved in cell wall biosynthesis
MSGNEAAHPNLALAVFVPAYEAERSLHQVISRIPDHTREQLDMILIQDDASTDATYSVALEVAAHDEKIHVYRNERNLGYGGTIKRAHARLEAAGIEAYVIVHGDLQHDPELIDAMLEPVCAGRADVVLGSRMMGGAREGGMPSHRWLANKLLTWRLNRALGLALTDYHTGFVAVTCDAMRRIRVDTCGDGHEMTADIVVRSATASLRILEIAVPTHYDEMSRSCTMWNSTKYALHVVRLSSQSSRRGEDRSRFGMAS